MFPTCYGPESITTAVRGWIDTVGAKTAFIEPGSPWDCLCESFNSKLRDELLNGEIFYSLAEARGMAHPLQHRASSLIHGLQTTRAGGHSLAVKPGWIGTPDGASHVALA